MVVIALALVAAALSALSAAGEQRAAFRLATAWRGDARRRGDNRVPPAVRPWTLPAAAARRRLGYAAAFATALLSSPLWLGSWATDAASFVGQSTALHLGSLSHVQLLMVTTLLFSLPLAALGSGRRPLPRDWIGALLVCGGLMAVLSTRSPSPSASPHESALAASMGIVLALAAVLVALSQGRRAPIRAALLASAAGALFSVGAATTKLAASIVTTEGIGGLLTSWAGYGLAAVSLLSFALQQAAFAAGPLAPAVTAVVIIDPLVSYVLGAVGFAESLPDGVLLVLVALGLLVVSAGVAVLARSPLLDPVREPVAARGAQPAPRACSRLDEPRCDQIGEGSCVTGCTGRVVAPLPPVQASGGRTRACPAPWGDLPGRDWPAPGPGSRALRAYAKPVGDLCGVRVRREHGIPHVLDHPVPHEEGEPA